MGVGVRSGVTRSFAVALGLTLVALGLAPAAAADHVSVIVQASDVATARAAVARVAGSVTTDLPIVSGVSARVPSAAVRTLRALEGVRAVTPDERVTVMSTKNPSFTTESSVYATETNATRLWAEGLDGTGVRVALIDTGVTEVPDLVGRLAPVPDPFEPGRSAPCVNFSGEATCNDSYGHGTFIAGLIAGRGVVRPEYRGVAPGSQIVSIKIAGRDGSADVTKVLAAIQYVVQFRNLLNIKVLNLSLGTNSKVSYRLDPLNFAVQRAWRSGITVVVAASNRGPDAGTISKPGDDPLVLTVGAVDDRATPAIDDDRIPRFTGRGPTVADGLTKPDVVAPGARVISLRAPNSYIEELAPGGGIDSVYRRGSGTSMSTGIVSGLAALLLQRNTSWTPDNVKYAFMATARRIAGGDANTIGRGFVDAYAASRSFGQANTEWQSSIWQGTGALDESRQDVKVSKPCSDLERALQGDKCEYVHGEMTAQGRQFDRKEFLSSWEGSSWYESQWAMAALPGSSWYGSSWYGSSWYGSSWYGSSWYGEHESQTSYGLPIPGSSWYGAWS